MPGIEDPGIKLLAKKLDAIAGLVACQLRGVTELPEVMRVLATAGWSQPEIAMLLGTTPKAVERALHRARKKGR